MSICSTAAPDPRKRVVFRTDDGIRPIFIPILTAFKVLGVKPTKGWGLVKQEKIKTILRDGRRLAHVESVEALAEEWLADESPPPLRKGLAEGPAASLAARARRKGRPRKRPAGEADGAQEARAKPPVPEAAGRSRTANKPTGKPCRGRSEAAAAPPPPRRSKVRQLEEAAG